MLLSLLWCASCGEAICFNSTICRASANNAECRVPPTFRNWSLLQEQVKNCPTVDIQLASGSHNLNENIQFQGNYLILHGSQSEAQSLVQCNGEYSVYFQQQVVYVANLAFVNCSTLNFILSKYTLQTVAVEKVGIRTNRCLGEWITNSTFRNSDFMLFFASLIAINHSTFD